MDDGGGGGEVGQDSQDNWPGAQTGLAPKPDKL